MQISIAVVEDNNLFRECISDLLASLEDFNVVGIFSNGWNFLENLEKIKPDVVLMDIAMPDMDGIETTRNAVSIDPQVRILALTMFQDFGRCLEIMDAGASGFILKDTNIQELEKAVRSALKGTFYFSERIVNDLIRKYQDCNPHDLDSLLLSEIEFELIQMVGKGYSNKDISDKLSVSMGALEDYKINLFKKLWRSDSILYK
jgi:DNA-binding NarL/FixJ family response regulator